MTNSVKVYEQLCPIRMIGLRSNTLACDIGHGWLGLSDRNTEGDNVMLMSRHTCTVGQFAHGAPYQKHLQTIIHAREDAESHPRQAPANSLVIVPLLDSEIKVNAIGR
jgi:hypothetical protein